MLDKCTGLLFIRVLLKLKLSVIFDVLKVTGSFRRLKILSKILNKDEIWKERQVHNDYKITVIIDEDKVKI